MPESNYRQYYEAERIAKEYLEAPHTLPIAENLSGWHFQLRLWHYPSFSPCRSWGVYRRRERGSRLVRTIVRQVIWNLSADQERFSQPEVGLIKGLSTNPTIDVCDRPVEGEAFDRCLEALKVIEFPAFASDGPGLDGEMFGIAVDSGPAIDWWCEGPESWRKLTVWAAETRAWLTQVADEPPQSELWVLPRPKLP